MCFHYQQYNIKEQYVRTACVCLKSCQLAVIELHIKKDMRNYRSGEASGTRPLLLCGLELPS